MPRHRWPAQLPPRDELGAVVHGPVVLARSPGIAAGLRCVFAHPGGLHLPLVLRADGVQAEAASRRTFPRHRPGESPPAERAREAWGGLLLSIEVDGESGIADPAAQEASGGADAFDLEASYWVGRLPSDRRLRLTLAWPRAGLAEDVTLLTLDDLHDLGDRVLGLR